MDIENQQTEGAGPEADLLALAMKADAGEINAEDPIANPEPAPQADKTESDKAKADEAKAKTEEKVEPEKGPETKPEDESKYAKAQKERERQDRSWKKLEEDKCFLRSGLDSIQAAKKAEELEEFAKNNSTSPLLADLALEKARVLRAAIHAQRDLTYRDSHGYSAEDYEAFAKNSEDADLAERAKAKAAALRKEEGDTKANASREEFTKGWQENLNKVLEADPDLKDENSEAGKALRAVLKDRPCFSTTPDGIKHAAEFAKLQRQSGLVSGLQQENQDLKTEIERLNKLTGITGSGPSKKPVTKSFDEMTTAEREAELTRMAKEADQSA